MLKAVTLDFWGTLVDDRTSGAPIRVGQLARWLPDVPEDEVAAAYAASWGRFQEAGAHGWGLEPAALLSMALDELGATLRPVAYRAVLAAWQAAHFEQPPALLPGVHDALRTLRARGLLIALISDTGATPGTGLREYLLGEGLHALFDWLTFSNETGVTKRAPQAFALTLAALGVAPSEAIHVGDTPATDIEGAHAAGLRAVMTVEVRDRGSHTCAPEAILQRMRDLPEVLDRLDSRG